MNRKHSFASFCRRLMPFYAKNQRFRDTIRTMWCLFSVLFAIACISDMIGFWQHPEIYPVGENSYWMYTETVYATNGIVLACWFLAGIYFSIRQNRFRWMVVHIIITAGYILTCQYVIKTYFQ